MSLFLYNLVPYTSVCNEPMIGGPSGVLRPVESFAVATFLVDGFTQVTVPSGSNSFTLATSDAASIRITRFILRVSEVCADNSALSVRIDYIIHGQLVSLISKNYFHGLSLWNFTKCHYVFFLFRYRNTILSVAQTGLAAMFQVCKHGIFVWYSIILFTESKLIVFFFILQETSASSELASHAKLVLHLNLSSSWLKDVSVRMTLIVHQRWNAMYPL